MRSQSVPTKYPASMRLLHWAMAVLMIGLIAAGLYMAGLPLEADNKFDLYPLHRAFGVLVFILLLVRAANRLRSNPPPMPAGIPRHEHRIAHIAHALLYLGMFAIPVFGYVASSAVPEFPGIEPINSIWFFGLELPIAPVEKNYDTAKFLITIHAWLAYAIIALISLHILGVIKHRFFDRPENNVLSRML